MDSIVERLTKLAKDIGYKLSEIITLDFHVDHIIPVSYYNLADANDIKNCWDARNLRWLPAKENISRGNRITFQDSELIKTLPKEIYPKGFNINDYIDKEDECEE